MKPMNFPARKLARQIKAKKGPYHQFDTLEQVQLEQAREMRTKKDRRNRASVR